MGDNPLTIDEVIQNLDKRILILVNCVQNMQMKERYELLKQIYNDLKVKVNVRSSHRILLQKSKKSNTLVEQISEITQIEDSVENQVILTKSKKVLEEINFLIKIKQKSELVSFKSIASAVIFTNKLQKITKMAQAAQFIRTIPLTD